MSDFYRSSTGAREGQRRRDLTASEGLWAPPFKEFKMERHARDLVGEL